MKVPEARGLGRTGAGAGLGAEGVPGSMSESTVTINRQSLLERW